MIGRAWPAKPNGSKYRIGSPKKLIDRDDQTGFAIVSDSGAREAMISASVAAAAIDAIRHDSV